VHQGIQLAGNIVLALLSTLLYALRRQNKPGAWTNVVLILALGWWVNVIYTVIRMVIMR